MKFVEKEEIINGVKVKTVTCIRETEEEKQEAEEVSKFWKKYGCHCNQDCGTYYVPDGRSKICPKHHYRCNHCRKIVQIG